jgi:acetyl-CoA C-acetyltransferase
MDSYFLGDRDISRAGGLSKAAERAYRMAGIGDPTRDLSLVELCDACAHQLPMWAEGLGLTGEGGPARWLDEDGPAARNVNLSGGMLNGNPLMLAGLARAAEAVLQLRGEAGERQVDGASRALAHGATGPAGQHHAVLVLES